MALVKDLYDLSDENRSFIEARFKASTGIEPHKAAIDAALYPDVNHRKTIQLSAGRRAISQYRKATGDLAGAIELMVFFVERGTQFTMDFGDIDETFYDSLEFMFQDVLDLLTGKGSEFSDRFIPRLTATRDSARNLGWGYYDMLCDMFDAAFPE